MPGDENQRRVFDFFVKHLDSKETFSRDDLEDVTDWNGATFRTHWSKQFRPLVIKVETGKYRVSEAFRRFATWNRFQQYVTQMRSTKPDYCGRRHDIVRIYEFFMPLSNEEDLRASLDLLFYKDTIQAQLKTIDSVELKSKFPQKEGELDEQYLERLCDWISDHFGGYSIYHVNGRFRAQPLRDRAKVGSDVQRYLVDETTAVTRFIFPCETEEEASQVEFFFTNLFVRTIIEMVNGEDEIWMAETGWENRLHIWRAAES